MKNEIATNNARDVSGVNKRTTKEVRGCIATPYSARDCRPRKQLNTNRSMARVSSGVRAAMRTMDDMGQRTRERESETSIRKLTRSQGRTGTKKDLQFTDESYEEEKKS